MKKVNMIKLYSYNVLFLLAYMQKASFLRVCLINMTTLDEWNKLVDKNWEHWEYYKDLFNYSLTKAANSVFTRPLYPFYYQQRLLKREFVENMQQLGELKPEEIEAYSKLSKSPRLKYAYKFYKKPTGRFIAYFPLGLLGISTLIPYITYSSIKPLSWYIVPTVLFVFFSTVATNKLLKLALPEVVDMTQWAIEKRKAKVWAEESNHPISKIASYPLLQEQIKKIAIANKP
jgi:hypothetical protein